MISVFPLFSSSLQFALPPSNNNNTKPFSKVIPFQFIIFPFCVFHVKWHYTHHSESSKIEFLQQKNFFFYFPIRDLALCVSKMPFGKRKNTWERELFKNEFKWYAHSTVLLCFGCSKSLSSMGLRRKRENKNLPLYFYCLWPLVALRHGRAVMVGLKYFNSSTKLYKLLFK